MGRLDLPSRAIMGAEDVPIRKCQQIAFEAARRAQQYAPKLTIRSASEFSAVWGQGFFGVSWEHPYVWYQESGTRPFTMRSLAGKTIPMWLDDKDGTLARKNPKAKTRITESGRRQVLIFRRAATMGARKTKWRAQNGKMTRVDVPASYPGAPGRIAVNRSQGILRVGDVNKMARNPGQIAQGNVGVRWRHPGLNPGKFIGRGLEEAAIMYGLLVGPIEYLNSWNTRPQEQRAMLLFST